MQEILEMFHANMTRMYQEFTARHMKERKQLAQILKQKEDIDILGEIRPIPREVHDIIINRKESLTQLFIQCDKAKPLTIPGHSVLPALRTKLHASD